MHKIAHIQIRPNGQILNQGCYMAYYGFDKLGFQVFFFRNAEEYQESTSRGRGTVVGGIDTLRKIMYFSGIQQPKVQQVHKLLSDFTKREMFDSTLGQTRKIFAADFRPFFLKPLIEDKTFTGFVCKTPMDLLKLRSLPDDFEILISEVVNLQSEFRVFIQDGKILDCKNYTGNFWLKPNPHIINEAIQSYINAPIAYTLDWGIDMDGNTVLIEINDAFGVAPYGLDPVKYARFLESRWDEMSLKKDY